VPLLAQIITIADGTTRSRPTVRTARRAASGVALEITAGSSPHRRMRRRSCRDVRD
jgi:hypothetical protein